jgi:hypothetical protein
MGRKRENIHPVVTSETARSSFGLFSHRGPSTNGIGMLPKNKKSREIRGMKGCGMKRSDPHELILGVLINITYFYTQALARRKVETAKIDEYIMALYFPDEASYQYVPYQQLGEKCAFDLKVTEAMDKEAWIAAKKKPISATNRLMTSRWLLGVQMLHSKLSSWGVGLPPSLRPWKLLPIDVILKEWRT